ncbi:MFS transporter, SP family, sugar:H+ symporter [Marchantia polymorpha subsp. ruderalis]|uniref:Major facilitator superfamily (MFS) profile domain-containing protein n=2 Tax=Marchantia polymorpha TaxID=3197 RepID=A0A176W463_MARPO|nr:hypothetical protein AXG93_1881s1090 [Marchantia polymorpha subsp. ruderalis]PTQ49637.1 hypothetical protein MARPO_0002s0114 [Marchantia polymorpha]PTQ49638.1 hypothetical protein MARPO_0002s0114 [Marchantia polymorpha]BBN00246.1 hypothetical protein Mp_1g27640 [Marchantia polymorpha subsp. ruderalis]BBN00247.1 hypothetical protein Mp_1g27640 [Marchantia polymorpha subsp. ruderalis]|eukprot:PTQ49637.1 hypothetical protein MARPO_0002s0114 [Marchantia polymorpha]
MTTQIADPPAGDLQEKKPYEGRTTPYVLVTVATATCIFMSVGYEINIAGGVSAMDSFLEEFFPDLLRKQTSTNNYCRFNDQFLQLYTSSLYLAALSTCLLASYPTRVWGRRASILISGLTFMVGTILGASAQNIAMLLSGRIIQGAALGICVQVTPMYIAEMAPAQTRGALMASLEIAHSIGIFAAGIVSYRAETIERWGWRLALGLAGAPGLVWVLGGVFLPDTPASTLQRGQPRRARAILEKIRGTANVDVEFADIAGAVAKAQGVRHAFAAVRQRRYLPQMVVGLSVPVFFQLTGANSAAFYAPVFFRSLGLGAQSSLYSNAILGAVKVVTAALAMRFVDLWGRKKILYQGGVEMFVFLIALGALLQYHLGLHEPLDKGVGIGVVVVFCLYVGAFTWSWGSLGFVIPGEIFPLEIRSAAMSLNGFVFYFVGFCIAQWFYIFLCAMRFGVFYFFAFWIVVMSLFVFLFVPETKGVGLERMPLLWEQHWFWKRFVTARVDVHPARAPDDV